MKSFDPRFPGHVSVDFLPEVGTPLTIVNAQEETEALEAVTATVAEMGRKPVKLSDLDLDGCLCDAPDNDRGVEEDAACEASFDSLAPLEPLEPLVI